MNVVSNVVWVLPQLRRAEAIDEADAGVLVLDHVHLPVLDQIEDDRKRYAEYHVQLGPAVGAERSLPGRGERNVVRKLVFDFIAEDRMPGEPRAARGIRHWSY